jgi:hypothetical protein
MCQNVEQIYISAANQIPGNKKKQYLATYIKMSKNIFYS